MKKNTLLYLDEEIVKRAKEHGLNISKITEEAIKSHLFPYLSIGEKARVDFEGYLKGLEKEKQCFFLPFEIRKVTLRNIGPCKDISIQFDKFNVITGPNGCGKTTMIRSLAYCLGDGLYEENLVKNLNGETKGSITWEISAPSKITTTFKRNENPRKNFKCILIDDGGARLTDKHFAKFVNYLKGLRIQVILTSFKENIRGAKIIKIN